MQTIRTEYFPPTNNRNSRIKATASGGMSCYVDTVDNLSINDNRQHQLAAKKLAKKLQWTGLTLFGGHTKNGMVWVVADEHNKIRIK